MKKRDEATIKQMVVDLYQGKFQGRARARTIAVAALDAGIFSWDEAQNRIIDSVERQVSRILKEVYESGTTMPLARPLPSRDEEGGEIWVQRRFWTVEDCAYVVRSLNDGVKKHYAALLAEYDYSMLRYGTAPEIVLLTEPYARIQAEHDAAAAEVEEVGEEEDAPVVT